MRFIVIVIDFVGGVQVRFVFGVCFLLVFEMIIIVFSVGLIIYEFVLYVVEFIFWVMQCEYDDGGVLIIGDVLFILSQKLLIFVFVELQLCCDGIGMSEILLLVKVVECFGWMVMCFNWKFDNVCDKFDWIGVFGMCGGQCSFVMNW